MRAEIEEVALALRELAAKRVERIHGAHTHCCGFSLDKNQSFSGCGHKWTHRMSDFDSDESFQKGHHCPKCGKGPWRWHLCEETLAEYDRRRAAGEIT